MSLTTAEVIGIVVVVAVVVIGTVVCCVFCWKALATISIEATKQGQSFSHTFRSSLRQGFQRLSGRSRRHGRRRAPSSDDNTPVALATNGAPPGISTLPKAPPSYDEALNHKLVRERLSHIQNGYHALDINMLNSNLDAISRRNTYSGGRVPQTGAQSLPASSHGNIINPSLFLEAQTAHQGLPPTSVVPPTTQEQSLAVSTAQSPPYRERYIGDEADEGGFLKAQEVQKPAKQSPPRALKHAASDAHQSDSERDAQSVRDSASTSGTLSRRHSQHAYTQFLQTATKVFQHHLSRQNLDMSGDDDAALSTTSNVSSGYRTQDTHSCNGVPLIDCQQVQLEGYCNPIYRSEGQLNLHTLPRSDSERSYCVTAVPRRHSDREYHDRVSAEHDSVVVFPDEDRDHILSETYI